MPFERYEILLPLNYNDGTLIEPEKFQETRRELVEQFGALTMDAPATDAFFRDFKERLKERFRQIEIWMTAYPIRLL